MKVALLMGKEKAVNETIKQALELQAVFLTAGLHKTKTKT
jgi:hypothetical protein